VDPTIGPARHRQDDRLAQDDPERINDFGGHRPQSGLLGPAREGATVVLQNKLGGQTNSM
jgi:hypothetical protein